MEKLIVLLQMLCQRWMPVKTLDVGCWNLVNSVEQGRDNVYIEQKIGAVVKLNIMSMKLLHKLFFSTIILIVLVV
jgi:hypothetical protein